MSKSKISAVIAYTHICQAILEDFGIELPKTAGVKMTKLAHEIADLVVNQNNAQPEQPVKWQPPGGPFLITAVGCVIDAPDRAGVFYDHQLIRRRRPTPQQAERSARELRTMEMLLAYRDAYCPDCVYVPGQKNWIPAYDHDDEQWKMCWDCEESATSVYFEYSVLVGLVDKLNAGEIDV